MNFLINLIEYGRLTTEYTIDTVTQSRPPPQYPEPALLHIECAHPDCQSLIVLIETYHLPA